MQTPPSDGDLPARADRAVGALLGLALGDALGMATQELSRRRAEDLLGAGPTFLAGPHDNPISAGLPAATVTDDTEQALLLARLLVEGGGHLDPRVFADALLDWEEQMAARGSLDLLGPSTKRALAAVRAGADPSSTGRTGTTNGAAMRIAPVGIATPCSDLDVLLSAVSRACRVTHDTPQARAGAVAVAAVVSAGVDGMPFAAALPLALEAAGRVDRGIAKRIRAAVALARGSTDLATAAATVSSTLDEIAATVGTSLTTRESVPAAFAVAALSPSDAWRAGWCGARLGGDSDTIAAMAGAMIGACTGAAALPPDRVAEVIRVNAESLESLESLVAGLLALRDVPSPPSISRVVGLASVLIDVTLAVPALPPRGGDVIAVQQRHSTTGRRTGEAGGGINALVAAARLGLPAAYGGPHGTGPHGDEVRAALDRDGIAVLAPATPDLDTGWCLALVEPDGERTFVTVPGAEAVLDDAALGRVRWSAGDAIYVSGYDLAYPGSGPALATWIAELAALRDGGPWVAFDPGPLVGEAPLELLRLVLGRVDLVSASAAEWATLAARFGGEAEWPTALAESAVVVRRDGAAPVTLSWRAGDRTELVIVPAVQPPGPVVDSNGAGDTHLGALLAGVSRGLPWPAAVALANRAAAWSLTRAGAASGPTMT